MRLQRFFLSKRNINEPAGTVAIDEPGLISQIRNVLRLHSGDRIVILDGEGGLFHCKLTDLARSSITAEILSREAAGGDPRVKLTVALPVLRGGRFEWALEKLTELGVSKVIPTIFSRSVARPAEKL